MRPLHQPGSIATISSPHPIGGFILAGGQSSRMGQDKAMLELAGRPLIEHAVQKLRRLCAEVHILSSEPALAAFAPLLPDRHPGCGPIGGMEAALAQTTHVWSLFLPVDVPFVPASFLAPWIEQAAVEPVRVAMFTVDGQPQPTLAILHRDLGPYLTAAIAGGDRKLFPTLRAAALDLSRKLSAPPADVFQNTLLGPSPGLPFDAEESAGSATQVHTLWFRNLNSPDDLQGALLHQEELEL